MAKAYWHGKEVMADLKKKLGDGMERAAIHLVNKIKQKVSKDQAYIRYVGQNVYYKGLNPSSPGQAPHLLTGQLRTSIAYEMSPDRLQAFVGSGAKHAAYLELGTSKMAARPFLRSTLAEERKTIAKFISGN